MAITSRFKSLKPMPEDSPNTRALAGEPENIPGYVKRKIRERKTSEKGTLVARLRPLFSTEKEQKLDHLLTPHLSAAVRAWVDGLKATKTAWNQQSHRFEDTGLPDHKVRAECALYLVRYAVGKAIERSMEVTGSYEELSTLLDELRQSPEAVRIFGAGFFDNLVSGQSTAEGKDSAPTPENETKPHPEQKTG
jgi:hypothetical protein